MTKSLDRRALLAVARKDIRAITANVQVWLPMLIVPLLLGVLLPTILVIALWLGGAGGSNMEAVLAWLDKLPAGALKATLAAMPDVTHRLVYLAANYLLAPIFLIIPLMTASVISADAFAGEKERGTLETILFSPIDMRSLFVGKVLASLIPAVTLSLATFLLAAISLNAAAWPLFHALFFPNLNWLPLLGLVVPMIALLAVLINLFISARVATFQAAYQMGGVVVLPVLLMVAGQVTGVVLFDWSVVMVVGLVLAVVDLLLLGQVLRRLDRNRLFASQIK